MKYQIVSVIEHHLGISKNSLDWRTLFVDDLNFDSLDWLELISELECFFDIEIDTSALKKSFSVSDMIDLVNQSLNIKKR